MHPALEHAPKTKKQAGRRLLKAFKEGKLQPPGVCEYTSRKGPCAIGSFFTSAQRRLITGAGLNYLGVKAVACEFGTANIEAMTKMSLEECEDVQGAFDNAESSEGKNLFIATVKKITGA